MNKRRELSLVIIPHWGARTIEHRFSVCGLVLLGIGVGLLLLALLVAGVFALRANLDYADYRSLRGRNAELTRQVGQIALLRTELERMKQEDEKIRAMLGFDQSPPPLDLEELYRSLSGDSAAAPESALSELPPGRDPLIPGIPPLDTYAVSRGMSAGHSGIDLVAPTGTPVRATADGRVLSAGWDTLYGNSLKLQHARGFVTFYGHLSRILRLPGDSVRQGQLIGYVGNTGRSTAPHLHYEVLRNRRNENPQQYFR